MPAELPPLITPPGTPISELRNEEIERMLISSLRLGQRNNLLRDRDAFDIPPPEQVSSPREIWLSKLPTDVRYGFHIFVKNGKEYFPLREVNREQCGAKKRRFERFKNRGSQDEGEGSPIFQNPYIDYRGETFISREKYEDFLFIAPTIRVDI